MTRFEVRRTASGHWYLVDTVEQAMVYPEARFDTEAEARHEAARLNTGHVPHELIEHDGVRFVYRQTCSCGWQGDWRSMPDFAAADHRTHVRQAAAVVGEGNQREANASEEG